MNENSITCSSLTTVKINSLSIRQPLPHLKLGLLRLDEFTFVKNIHNRREAESKGKSFLVSQLFNGEDTVIEKTPNGKPFLPAHPLTGISVSHSHNMLAVLTDSKNICTGLDIELIRDKVLNIRHKFLSESEKSFIPADNVKMHIMAWCVKEALYKIHSERGVDFIKHLKLEPFSDTEKNITATCTKSENSFTKTFEIEDLGGYILAWPRD